MRRYEWYRYIYMMANVFHRVGPTVMLSLLFGGLTIASSFALAKASSLLPRTTANVSYSGNVANCPGYTLGSVTESDFGLTARLSLAGAACNAFGTDINDLTIEVTYQSQTTVHVKIYDTANLQFTVPDSVVPPPPAPTTSYTNSSDLVFNYDASPFAFWITRRSDPDAMPIFDTRISSLPPTPIAPFNESDPSTAFDGFPLVFEDQYLQITSALPYGTNIYGLGEVVASSGFRRDIGTNGGIGTIQTHWNRDSPTPFDENMYGTHPVYLEHRFNETTNKSSSSGVLLLSAAGKDILLQTPPNSNVSLIQYRMISGILDFYFFSGPSDVEVISQYGAIIGYPMWQPSWGFGFHLSRWGYQNVSQDIENVAAMRAANIPMEVQWNDIDIFHAYRDFTSDPVSFPPDEMRVFTQQLAANHQYYIPIVDPVIGLLVNSTDVYDPFTSGSEKDVFVKNPNGSLYIGTGWPGYSAFPDWFGENTQDWWTEALSNWSEMGVGFSGIWLDMNEATSMCSYSCGTGANLSAIPPIIEAVVTWDVGYPECYNETYWGPSGNMTINGTSTDSCIPGTTTPMSKRGIGAGDEPNLNIFNPPYTIHNAVGSLNYNDLATQTTHHGGYLEYDVHNLWGIMEEKTTHIALQTIFPGKRVFMISRSTFVSAGRWTGHWLGDNFSRWEYMAPGIQGVLQFQIYQIPMVGPDACGFNYNTDEELCNRWMQMNAFFPFYRNHNTFAALSQEPYRWESVANASRTAIAARYSMLPYWYTLFANASTQGLPPVRALFYEFPDEPELFSVDRQWLIGKDILITPVMEPGATTVDGTFYDSIKYSNFANVVYAGIFPGRGTVTWRDWWTHAVVVDANAGTNTTLDAPLGHINVHIRDNSALLLYLEPGYTTYETRQGPFSLLVSLSKAGTAFGDAYIDDGISDPPGPNRTLTFQASNGMLEIKSTGEYAVQQKLERIMVLGVQGRPEEVTLEGGKVVEGWTYDAGNEELVVANVSVELNGETKLSWA
ncbi:glycoside hydrolase family 31 protein [Phlebopus sp. FC_14]|nr:glycoside hydrolase family 31 protein [Phlebopus sp. FC_14]